MSTIKKNIVNRYESIGEFLAACEPEDDRHAGYASVTSPEFWSGTPDLATAVKWAAYGGWEFPVEDDLAGKLERIVGRLRKTESWQPELVHDVYGSAGFDLDAYLVGDPNCFISEQPRWGERQSHVVTVLIDHCYSSGTDQVSLARRGLALIVLVRVLQAMGMDLELWSEITVEGNNGSLCSQLVCLKKAGSVADTEGVEFAVGNTSWLRRLFFARQELLPERDRKNFRVGAGYGTVLDPVHRETVGADVVLSLKDYWGVEGADPDGADMEKWLAKVLDKAGVEHGLGS